MSSLDGTDERAAARVHFRRLRDAADAAGLALFLAQRDGATPADVRRLAFQAARAHRAASSACTAANVGGKEALGWGDAAAKFDRIAREVAS